MSESASTPNPPSVEQAATTAAAESPNPLPSSTELTPAPAEKSTSNTPQPEQQNNEPQIDPELMDLPAPPHHNDNNNNDQQGQQPTNGSDQQEQDREYLSSTSMGIRESIASAPNPRPADFPPPDQLTNETLNIDLDAIAQIAAESENMPGSPTAKMMRAIAPPTAIMTNPEWAPPPPNASVNLFIGRALLSNGNDNWPLKPNEIVNWIRSHYPSEWDGDEGRCSAHRVRTYLARKGADMYYEKLNQGCINGWRIRANHLWRFENGGFQGRGMKQEEAQANAQKEHELLAQAARKEAAAAALAAGHPGIKVSMSNPGISTSDINSITQSIHNNSNNNNSSLPSNKKPKISGPSSTIANAPTRFSAPHNGVGNQSRRRRTKINQPPPAPPVQPQPIESYSTANQSQASNDLSLLSGDQSSYYQQQPYAPIDQSQQSQSQAGPSTILINSAEIQQQHANLDPGLNGNTNGNDGIIPTVEVNDNNNNNNNDVDINMVQQAMQAAAASATQMDDLEMGIQLPIEMQMHSNEHENDDDTRFNFGTVVNTVSNQNGQSYGQDSNFGYTG
ncbi:uncharacterized protein L201_000814 [Kwoniella dendrophila CBS 6074]|uniref:Fork-head domain-containing protein n=1 Tax=Kwoniella dendrophila CBS 6074 TaxID=1295534 RepID=A0AAX4JME0_9TREE